MHRYGRVQRGGRRGWAASRTPRAPVVEEPPAEFPPADGSLLKTLTKETLALAEATTSGLEITDCEFIASYNWLEGTSDTILCPGAPPRWTPLSEPVTLKQDSGGHLRDVNAANSPVFPMEPALRASMQMKPELNLKSIKICACHSTLASLVRFVRDIKKPCRFWVEVIGDTAFFVRRERSPKEVIENLWGYGHTFPEAYTTWPEDAKGSASHQRILTYNFAGMKMLVRFEGDGYLEGLAEDDGDQDSVKPRGGEKRLDEAFSELLHKGPAASDKKLVIETGGRMVAQQAVFDLKTRSIKKIDQDILSEELPRLWLSQTSNLILAFHSYGKFETINVKRVVDDIKTWEKNNQSDLARFAQLLRIILEQASQTSKKKLEVRTTNEGKLELRDLSNENWFALPPDLREHLIASQHEVSGQEVGMGKDSSVQEKMRSDSSSSLPWPDDEEEDDDDKDKDYTACSKECGYCGKCLY